MVWNRIGSWNLLGWCFLFFFSGATYVFLSGRVYKLWTHFEGIKLDANVWLGGDFKHFVHFYHIPGEMIYTILLYNSNGFKPPTTVDGIILWVGVILCPFFGLVSLPVIWLRPSK